MATFPSLLGFQNQNIHVFRKLNGPRRNSANLICSGYSQLGHKSASNHSPILTPGYRTSFCSYARKMHVVSVSLQGEGSTSEDGLESRHELPNNADILSAESGKVGKFCAALASIFPVWVILASGSAMVKPHLFTWIKGNVMVAALALTMLGMGTTLSLEDLKAAFSMPRELLAGVILQYTVMPSLGYAVTSAMGLPQHYSIGIILVACCPGGTASNIVTYLARGNVALSVLMTAVSTVLAVVMTPLLTSQLAGKFVPVNGAALFNSTLQVVLLPVLLGALANHFFPITVRQVSVVSPLVAVLTVAAVVGSAVASSAHAIQVAGVGKLMAAVAMLHGGGFLLGYILSKTLSFSEPTSRTVAIEVGMQNSVLGVLLATQHFANPLTAAPCALSSVTHSLMGSLLAAFWRYTSTEKKCA